MKRLITPMILLMCVTAILAAGCTTAPAPAPVSKGDMLFAQAEKEFQDNNLFAAGNLFKLAQENYTADNDTAAALKTRDRAMTVRLMTFQFTSNRSVMDRNIATAFPDASSGERAGWMDDTMIVTLQSDGEVWYHDDTISNIFWHNTTLMRKAYAARNYTPFYDDLTPLAFAMTANGTGQYGEPVSWEGFEELSVSRDKLPATGTLKLWIPLPVESGSQTNVTIVSVEPARYVKSMTGTGADLGLAYLEIPLEEMKDPFLNVTARFRFIQHRQHFSIDPAAVKPYNTSSPEYLKYTSPGKNIVITPEMKKKAQEIVGNETNPYLQAQKIYWNIVDTYPYSHPPIFLLEMTNTPLSTYFLTTGIGDCGTQSQYFAALCRSLGIPARVPVGYQMIAKGTPPGIHVWAEYYLEGYGWVPVDVTVAEGAEWSYNATGNERHRYKEYFFGNLDPYRYIIQNDVDILLTPDPGDAVVFSRSLLQNPDAVCDTCTDNPGILFAQDWTVTMTKR
ncbi:MAG: transglutaminase domain-containing protein [Methanoregula sp.]|nr:transglutaminase domain-containing protein [Methanoregula sp.]